MYIFDLANTKICVPVVILKRYSEIRLGYTHSR